LWAPHYGASISVAFKRFWKKYATFSGRASRSEYWYWTLITTVVTVVLEIIAGIAGGAGASVSANGTTMMGAGGGIVFLILGLWGLATVVPSLALLARRLHDGNFSALLILIGLIPVLGAITLFVLALMPSNPQGQRFDQPVGEYSAAGRA
jgi:uncharacterized membrane protein YhaH (DUF805 family)